MRYKICCVGHVTIDKIITPTTVQLLPGGTAFYFSQALRHANISYALVTAVAPADRYLLDEVTAPGITLIVQPSVKTIMFENWYGADQNHRTQRVTQTADPFLPEWIAGVDADIFHLGPLLAADIPLDLIKQLASRGNVSLDVQGFLRRVENHRVWPAEWPDKTIVLPLLHFIKASEEELQVLTGTSDIKGGAKALWQAGAKEVIVTLGSRGSVIFDGALYYKIPAYQPFQIVDATGCGDTFMAGYLYQRCQGATIEKAGRFAAAMAALKIEAFGPFTGTPAAVEGFMQTAKTTLERPGLI